MNPSGVSGIKGMSIQGSAGREACGNWPEELE